MLRPYGAPTAANHATATTPASAQVQTGSDQTGPASAAINRPIATRRDRPSSPHPPKGRRNLRRTSVQEKYGTKITVRKPTKNGCPTSFTTIINMATIGHLPWPRHLCHIHRSSDDERSLCMPMPGVEQSLCTPTPGGEQSLCTPTPGVQNTTIPTTISITYTATSTFLPWSRHCRHTHHSAKDDSSDQR